MSDNEVCVLDNGAFMAKIGLNTHEKPKLIPNCIMKAKSERRRAFIGNQVEDCRDLSGLFYLLGFQRGYITNWDIQKTVWDFIFSPDCTSINLCDRQLIITEPQFDFTSIQEVITEIFFEEYECEALHRTTAADLSAYNYLKTNPSLYSCCIVVDLGYSFTHIVPFVQDKKIKSAIRRIDIGGKVLTNHLKEIISYRHINVMDESYVVNQIKEDVCFVSQNFREDMMNSTQKYPHNKIIQEYVLPDFTTVKRGYVRKRDSGNVEQQSLRLNNERFTVPELLFHPSDVGIQQMGIAEAILNCLEDIPSEIHHLLLSNIIVVGGCAMFPGLKTRLLSEVRALSPDDVKINIFLANDPITYAWSGGKLLSKATNFRDLLVTREEYEEQGVRLSIDKFDV